MMNFTMVTKRNNSKVFYSIVMFFSIYMMNMFRFIKRSTDIFFHDNSVLSSIFSFGYPLIYISSVFVRTCCPMSNLSERIAALATKFGFFYILGYIYFSASRAYFFIPKVIFSFPSSVCKSFNSFFNSINNFHDSIISYGVFSKNGLQ